MSSQEHRPERHAPTPAPLVVLAWLAVGVPMGYGLWQTVLKAVQLLGG